MAQDLAPSRPKEEQPQDLPAPVQAEIQDLLEAGAKLFKANEDVRALAVFKKAYVLSGNFPESPTRAVCLFNLGAAYVATGKPEKALRCFQKAKKTGATGEHDADFCFNVAAAYEHMERYQKAAEFYRKAVGGGRVGNPQRTGDALVKLAYCLVSLGETASAVECFRSAAQAYRKARLTEEAAMAMREAANYFLQSRKHSPEDVLELLGACEQLCAGIANQKLQGKLYNDLGLHYVELGRFEEAERCFKEALLLCCCCWSRGEDFSAQRRAVLLQNLGALCNARGQFARSLRYHSQAADLYGALGGNQQAARAQSLYNLATAHGRLKNHHTAEFYYQQARKAFAEAGDRSGEARVSEAPGATHFRQGGWDRAAPCYREALGLFEESKETPEIPRERIQEKLAAIARCQAGARGHASLGRGAGVVQGQTRSCRGLEETKKRAEGKQEEQRRRPRCHLASTQGCTHAPPEPTCWDAGLYSAGMSS